MELYIWPSDFGLPSVDSRCLQFMACAKFCAAPVSVISACSPWKSHNGEYPMFIDRSNMVEKIYDFDKFADILRRNAQEVVLDSELSTSEKCEFEAYSSLMHRNFYPAELQFLWLDSYNYSAIMQHWYSKQLPFGYNLYYLEKRRKRAQAYVSACGRNEKQIIHDAINTVNFLEDRLGNKKYFYGDKPSSIDALIFGYLAPILKLPLPSDRLQQHIMSCPNVVRFIESIISIYLPLSETQIRQQAALKDKWYSRRRRAQKEAGQMNLRRTTVKEQQTSGPVAETIFFAVGALTISVLFAVHCGLVTFGVVEEEPPFEML
ncbi:Metaxin 1 homolog, putative [Brugia malayi]|uniref:BMA-MTX-1 n=1 Tax=Brugia malayi TaxID=6279 RepID=A0A0H5S2R1_BRUMA|nr:Metaxin 1 homolog, putative [Brugia malayi]CRZ22994.1 BMA-MTX-1 [Brugia malayi]VIO95466.1 Metaxin 1 homolog, putative [Brugia malayi]